ncbi:PLP-dependent aminotransferase family protein [Massilia sp. CFBP9012]|uniref:MocR-like pyridoxine biosynthesis transcription factor PdxR n=1 Tax=Massilia sp. CFBP9012 TaxID=3096531 RepID=UPI002A6AAD48|nr:PLP-dependent aminotransferase family protein [Massilia sp. CFBP9012]MDY0975996.1 PLP-dependent aminotransferase family protein [Massilia sp. CFBP9012]
MTEAPATRSSRRALALGAPAPGETLQRWLYRSLRQAILDGRLGEGALLPGTRALAQQYAMARGTVQLAYDQLLSEGYLQALRGSGTRVSRVLPDASLQAGPAPVRVLEEPSRFQPDGPWLRNVGDQAPAFPLRPGSGLPPAFHPHRCDVRGFPIDLWRRLHGRHLRPSKLAVLSETEAAGMAPLRAAIARHLDLARGVAVSPDQIVILGSVQQALDICLRLLVAPGDAVWMEDPGYPGARQAMHAHGARVVDVAVDEDGIRVHEALAAASDARLAYVTPARQAPLGMALSPERRLALLQWARERGAIVFEDDYDSEYRFAAKPVPALRSMEGAESHVVLAGTFSKLLFPAIRLAFVALPWQLVDPFVRAASLAARNANALSQAVLADFIDDGHFDRHVRRMRRVYAGRAAAFEAAAHAHWQGLIAVPPVTAGLDVVTRLLAHEERDAWQRLNAAGLTAFPLGPYCAQAQLPPSLVMGFAAFDEAQIDAGAKAVAAALRGRH